MQTAFTDAIRAAQDELSIEIVRSAEQLVEAQRLAVYAFSTRPLYVETPCRAAKLSTMPSVFRIVSAS